MLGNTDPVPGLMHRYLPKMPSNEPIKLVQFTDVYLKNIEVEIPPRFENTLISFAANYRKEKHSNFAY
jgi:hypothetical protein